MNTTLERSYGKGLMAGFVGTVVLSAIMMIKAAMGFMPQLDVIGMLSNMLGGSRATGWLAHFVIGTVIWGLLYTAVFGAAPDGHWWRGIVLGIAAWLMMMVVVMPMAGAGLFGMSMGIVAPVMTLMLHVVYGWVLGAVYGTLVRRSGAPTPARAI
ncbi:MAG: DUF6789 family protein [Casimicrobiaceae bacterium]